MLISISEANCFLFACCIVMLKDKDDILYITAFLNSTLI